MHLRVFSTSTWVVAVALAAMVLLSPAANAAKKSTASSTEKGLVGVRCGRTSLEVLRVYGNPTRVRTGSSFSVSSGSPGSMPGAMPGIMPGGMEGPAPMMGGPGMLPQIGGEGFMPGMGPMGNAGPMPGVDTTGAPAGQRIGQEVVWTYELPKGNTLEVYVDDDGNVDQVTASGVKWGSVKTARGITLGDRYKTVLARYGFPDQHESLGALQMIRYTDRFNIAFILDPRKLTVVAIVVSRPS